MIRVLPEWAEYKGRATTPSQKNYFAFIPPSTPRGYARVHFIDSKQSLKLQCFIDSQVNDDMTLLYIVSKR